MAEEMTVSFAGAKKAKMSMDFLGSGIEAPPVITKWVSQQMSAGLNNSNPILDTTTHRYVSFMINDNLAPVGYKIVGARNGDLEAVSNVQYVKVRLRSRNNIGFFLTPGADPVYATGYDSGSGRYYYTAKAEIICLRNDLTAGEG